MNGERGGAIDTEALLIGSVLLILALVPFLLASRRFEMPTGNEYSDVRFDKSNGAERQQSNLGVSGGWLRDSLADQPTEKLKTPFSGGQ